MAGEEREREREREERERERRRRRAERSGAAQRTSERTTAVTKTRMAAAKAKAMATAAAGKDLLSPRTTSSVSSLASVPSTRKSRGRDARRRSESRRKEMGLVVAEKNARKSTRGRDVSASAFFEDLQKDFTKLFKGDPSEACQKKYQEQLDRINALEPTFKRMSDEELREKTAELRERVQGRMSRSNAAAVTNDVFTDDIVCECFALVREGSVRSIGLRPFDCQMIGGLVLHSGEIAEMGTGEGKTLVSVAPAFLNSLTGLGVHVVTVNDYLARRDAEWVGRVHTFLGLKVGLIQSGGAGLIGGQIAEAREGESVDPEIKREAYRSDITYVTNSELGFDFLRDNLAATKEELVLRDNNPYYCIIDEVDSILIDEARTPLIISGQAEQPSSKYERACKIAQALVKDEHYTVEEKRQTVLLTEEGYEVVESVLQVNDLYDPREQWISFVSNAVKAKELQKKDVNYIVKGGEIIIIDEFTGRTMPGRRWGEGLHQAIEAKESLKIQNETVTLASISYQNFFRAYQKKSGMTGTAATESAEFESIYNLQVSVVPTNKPSKRNDNPDVVFRSESGKWNAVMIEIRRMHKTGRPVLVGTTSVEESERLAASLDEEGIPYQLLNAKPENVQRESEIVAQSGRLGAVTISTNMAGRGTDILLGGNADFMARLKVREILFPEIVGVDAEPVGKSIVKGKKKKQAQQSREWNLAEELYPCVLSDETQELLESLAKAVSTELGGEKITELEASDKLARACEMSTSSDKISKMIQAAYLEVSEEYAAVTKEEKAQVLQLGGLHVIGTERHESRRIDNQLRGRSGRQGDSGSTRFFLSLEDKIFRIFGGERVKAMMSAFRVEDLPIESQMLTSALNEAQRKVEAYFYDIRKQLFEYDEVLNIQREKVYAERRRALLATQLSDQMVEYAELTVNDVLEANVDPASPEETWNLEGLAGKMKQYCYMLEDLDGETLKAQGGYEGIRRYLQKRCVDAYNQKVQEVNGVEDNLMAEAEQFFVLTQYDNLWKAHLQSIKFLQTAVGLRGYAQRDPLTEFKLEGYNLFLEMMAQVRRNCIYSVYQFKPEQVVNQTEDQKEDQKVKT